MAPAPRPFPIFTTARPGAHDWSIEDSAVIPTLLHFDYIETITTAKDRSFNQNITYEGILRGKQRSSITIRCQRNRRTCT